MSYGSIITFDAEKCHYLISKFHQHDGTKVYKVRTQTRHYTTTLRMMFMKTSIKMERIYFVRPVTGQLGVIRGRGVMITISNYVQMHHWVI